MFTAPWHASIYEIEAAISGRPVKAARPAAQQHFALTDYLERWSEIMDNLLGQRHVNEVAAAEWIALSEQAEVVALAA